MFEIFPLKIQLHLLFWYDYNKIQQANLFSFLTSPSQDFGDNLFYYEKFSKLFSIYVLSIGYLQTILISLQQVFSVRIIRETLFAKKKYSRWLNHFRFPFRWQRCCFGEDPRSCHIYSLCRHLQRKLVNKTKKWLYLPK